MGPLADSACVTQVANPYFQRRRDVDRVAENFMKALDVRAPACPALQDSLQRAALRTMRDTDALLDHGGASPRVDEAEPMKIDAVLLIALGDVRRLKEKHRIDLEIRVDLEPAVPLDASHRSQIVHAKVIVELTLVPGGTAEPSMGRHLSAHAAIERPLVQI